MDSSFIAVCRKIVAEHQCQAFNGVLIDAFTASACVQVFDKLNEANKARVGSMDFRRYIDLVWEVLK